jgi:hypothetical protein
MDRLSLIGAGVARNDTKRTIVIIRKSIRNCQKPCHLSRLVILKKSTNSHRFTIFLVIFLHSKTLLYRVFI